MLFLAIEPTEIGAVVHGASSNLAELRVRVKHAIVDAVIPECTSEEEQDDICDAIVLHLGEQPSVEDTDLIVTIYETIIGSSRTALMFEEIHRRFTRVQFTQEE